MHKAHDIYAVRDGGFMATIAVILLATGIMALSLSAASAAVLYSDAVAKRELRIQARMNAKACLDTAALMVVKDYFLDREADISEFGCKAGIANDLNGNVSLDVKAELGGVSARAKGILRIDDHSATINSVEVY